MGKSHRAKKPYLIYTTQEILVNEKWKWIKSNVLLISMQSVYYKLMKLSSVPILLSSANFIIL